MLTIADGRFSTEDNVFASIDKFTEDTVFVNKDDWKEYAAKLDEACTRFMSDDVPEDQPNE